jgi:cytoskeletal protein RodZ
MKKYKNLILIVTAIIVVTAAVLTFIIWQSFKLSNDLKNSPDAQIRNQGDKSYNLEDKDTTWKNGSSSTDGEKNSSSDKDNDNRDTEKKGNGSGNDRTTDKTPASLAPIDQSNGTVNTGQFEACAAGHFAPMTAELEAIDANTRQAQAVARSEGTRINNAYSQGQAAGDAEMQAYKNAHGGRTPQDEETHIADQGKQQKQVVINRYTASQPNC